MNARVRLKRRRRSESGASLIELTCALFILTFGVFGALQLHMLGMDKARAVNEYAVAVRTLDNELETLRALPFEALEAGVDLPFRSDTPASAALVNARGRTAIEDVSGDTRGLKKVRVGIRWTGEHGRIIEKHMTTLIAEKR